MLKYLSVCLMFQCALYASEPESLDSPISRLEKQNLTSAIVLGMVPMTEFPARLSTIREGARLRRAARFRLSAAEKNLPRCTHCNLRLIWHYGGVDLGERWCELNNKIVMASLAGNESESTITQWKREQKEIESGKPKEE